MIKILCALTFVTSISFAYASKGGGGGASVVCKDQKGVITKVELLDLYQQEMDGRTIERSNVSTDQQLKKTLGKTDKFFAYDILKTLEKVKMEMLPAHIVLQQKYDLGDEPVLIEDNCSIEWVAFYSDGNESLRIVTKYYSLMSHTDQAALLLHEAIYRMIRALPNNYGREIIHNSSKTRKITGELFVNDTDLSLIDKLTEKIRHPEEYLVEVKSLPATFTLVASSKWINYDPEQGRAKIGVSCQDEKDQTLSRADADLSLSSENETKEKKLVVSNKCRYLRIGYEKTAGATTDITWKLYHGTTLILSTDVARYGYTSLVIYPPLKN